MRAPSDSSEQSSNALLIAQEVWGPTIALSPSFISFIGHTAAIKTQFSPQQNCEEGDDLRGCGHCCTWVANSAEVSEALPLCDWFQWTVSVQLSVWLNYRAGFWGSHISCLRLKGNLREWAGDKDRSYVMCRPNNTCTYTLMPYFWCVKEHVRLLFMSADIIQ